ncbi:hypothetical protein BDN71DRAFT_1435964 [Pleurotus eryngii]|uniref:Uncharacterized protein n=1 Tax=Pleurotus eryngii TaxID=5323 RepID=A0A9P5ZK10_PLEER|nr:hypothetical protein BDN71DRAFT_1435964 [Pleurotus eryngii]
MSTPLLLRLSLCPSEPVNVPPAFIHTLPSAISLSTRPSCTGSLITVSRHELCRLLRSAFRSAADRRRVSLTMDMVLVTMTCIKRCGWAERKDTRTGSTPRTANDKTKRRHMRPPGKAHRARGSVVQRTFKIALGNGGVLELRFGRLEALYVGYIRNKYVRNVKNQRHASDEPRERTQPEIYLPR